MKREKQTNRTHQGQEGFTLVELSIVLVIIGLIVGGVLVGQELIKGAEIRALITQIDKYNAAVNTFRSKFDYLPGDIPEDKTTMLGLATASGVGNNNRLIEGDGGNGDGERTLFWQHLSQQGMIEGSFDGSQTSGIVDLNGTFPPAKAGAAGIGVYDDGSSNYYYIGVQGLTGGVYDLANALTQVQAYEVDRKIDDGKPMTGRVRAVQSASGTDADADSSTDGCVVGASPSFGDESANYNMEKASANEGQRLCQLRMQMQ